MVLPCVESMVHASRFAALRAAPGLALLAVALPSTLLFRVRSDGPDAIVIAAGEAFLASVGTRSSLQEVFSDTPTVLLAAEPGAAIARSAARLKIFSVLPTEVSNWPPPSPPRWPASLSLCRAGLPRQPTRCR